MKFLLLLMLSIPASPQEAVKVVEVKAEILPCLDTEPSGKNAWIISPALNVWSANVNTSAVRYTCQ
jgi:hypothetical protein